MKIPLNQSEYINVPDVPLIDWQGIIIHHSATADGKTLSSFEAIKQYHMETQHWGDIGYHFVIEYVNGGLTLRAGRDLNTGGAHTQGKNTSHIGVCVVGNFDVDSPDDNHYRLVSQLCGALMCGYAKINVSNIKPHNLYAPFKSCPGHLFDFARLILAVEKV